VNGHVQTVKSQGKASLSYSQQIALGTEFQS